MNKQTKMIVYVFVFILFLFYVYYFSTKFVNRIITIKDEFNFFINDGGVNLIQDTNNVIYRICDVSPILHFRSAEILATIQPQHTYTISGFGVRLPYLYPIITKVSKRTI